MPTMKYKATYEITRPSIDAATRILKDAGKKDEEVSASGSFANGARFHIRAMSVHDGANKPYGYIETAIIDSEGRTILRCQNVDTTEFIGERTFICGDDAYTVDIVEVGKASPEKRACPYSVY